MKKILVAHDFNLNLYMYNLQTRILKSKKFLNKKIIIKKSKNLSSREKKNVQVFWGNRLNINTIKKYKNLKFVHFGSKGVDEEVIFYLKKNKIKYTVSKKIFVDSVVSSIIAAIFSSSRAINFSYMLRKKNCLDRKNIDLYKNYINNVFNESFLLVGFGEINKRLFRLLKNISKNITIINRSKVNIKKFKSVRGLNKLILNVKNKKFIINTLPLTKNTKNIFNKKIFKNFSDYTVFINYGRGDTINLNDLRKIINKKKITACLDVFNKAEYVNPSRPFDNSFFLLKNFKHIITPHIGSYDNEYWIKQINLFSENLRKVFKIFN